MRTDEDVAKRATNATLPCRQLLRLLSACYDVVHWAMSVGHLQCWPEVGFPLGVGLSLSVGQRWNGHPVDGSPKVGYVDAEGRIPVSML